MNEQQPPRQPEQPHEKRINLEALPPAERPRVWVGSLADYNAGRLHGEWMDAAVDETELLASIQGMLARSPEPGAEEWGIFDHDNFVGFRVGEYQDLATVTRVARGIAEHGPAFATWAELHDGEPTKLAQFAEVYFGEHDTAEAWARELFAGTDVEAAIAAAVPDSLQGYISFNYASFAHDAQLNGEIHVEPAPGGRVWIFLVL